MGKEALLLFSRGDIAQFPLFETIRVATYGMVLSMACNLDCDYLALPFPIMFNHQKSLTLAY